MLIDYGYPFLLLWRRKGYPTLDINIILTEYNTYPLIGGSLHTAVFSIRTVVCGTTRQNKACSINNSGDQLVPSCSPATSYHCIPIRKLPLYSDSPGVADPGTW